MTPLVATGEQPVDVDRLRGIAGLESTEGAPVDALVEASARADLVIVGSRGLHGRAALGSVSERVAHRAASSVLVVRPGLAVAGSTARELTAIAS